MTGSLAENDRSLESSAEALNQQGIRLSEANRFEEAEASFRQATQMAPQFVWGHHNLGILLMNLGRSLEAEACFRRAIEVRPEYPEVYHSLGVLLSNQGRVEEAEAAYRQAIRQKPDYSEAHYNLGGVLYTLGIRLDDPDRLQQAEIAFQRAIQIQPSYAEAYNNLGALLRHVGREQDAETAFRQAVQIQPGFAEAHSNLGVLLRQAGRITDAEAAFRKALQYKPDYPDALYNLGNLLKDEGRLDEAEATYRTALRIKPDYAETYWNLSLLQLLRGNFAEGWAAYEYRWESIFKPFKRSYPQPQWDGHPFPGRTLFVFCEQGAGDNLQFIRYLPQVAALGGKVILECPAGLYRLFKDLPGTDRVIQKGDPIPPFDAYCPLLTLPLLFKTRLETIPAEIPYLNPPTEIPPELSIPNRPAAPFQVGLVWSGNPDHKNDRYRSIPFEQVQPLLNMKGITWVILQKEHRPPGLHDLAQQHGWVDLMGEVNDFADTATLLRSLDLVIGVDTSVIHLAGALGQPTWLLLPANPDWRWLLEREDSPWYPTFRLFRQQKLGHWPEVIARVANRLASLPGSSVASSHRIEQQESVAVLQVEPALPPLARQPAPLRAIYPLARRQRLIEAKHGFFLYQAEDTQIGRMLEFYGEHAEHEWVVLQELLSEGDQVIEIGANLGVLTIPFAQKVTSHGSVMTFESEPADFHLLCANLALNDLSHVEAYPLMPGNTENSRQRIKLKLDAFCGNSRPRLIKINTQAQSVEILRGAARLLECSRPLLYIRDEHPENRISLLAYLQFMNYRCYRQTVLLFNPHNYFRYPYDLYQVKTVSNLLCLPQEMPLIVEGLEEVKT
jgi:tetratricopeptide (TPR) repeat protein